MTVRSPELSLVTNTRYGGDAEDAAAGPGEGLGVSAVCPPPQAAVKIATHIRTRHPTVTIINLTAIINRPSVGINHEFNPGSNISFLISLDFGGMPFELSYKGVVSLEQIQFSGDAGGMPFEFVVKKVSQ
jgi:hypothetical protein